MLKVLRAAAILCICILASFCSKPRGTTYCSVGTEELNAAMDAWSALYKPAPQHEGRGSRVGAKALAEGLCEMAASSEILPDEDIDLIKRRQKLPTAIPVAEEVLAIIASKDFPADTISVSDLAAAYAGGPDAVWPGLKITAHGINTASDRYFFFRRAALDGRPGSDRVLEAPGPLALVDRVAKGASLGYARPLEATPAVKILRLTSDGKALAPEDAGYPLRRYYYIYVTSPSNETKAFLKFVLSDDGQKALKPLGLVPLEAHARTDALLRLETAR